MLSEISRLAIPVRNHSYRFIVIPAKAGIYRQYEAWIPAFAGMTFLAFSGVRQHERFRFCIVRSAKQKRGDISGYKPQHCRLDRHGNVGVGTPTYVRAVSAQQHAV
jgi:hypothetical protein